MILIDSRTGSKEFLRPIQDLLHASDGAELVEGYPADFGFDGILANGPATFGIERKTIEEMCSKAGRDRLVDHQIPMMQAFGFDRRYLLVEGYWAPEPDGRLKKFGRPSNMMYSSVDNFINSRALVNGMIIIRSGSKDETARKIVNLFNLVQKPWKKHTSHLACYEDTIHMKRPNLLYKWGVSLEGIRDVNVAKIIKAFKSGHELAHADIDRLERALGHRKIATKVWKEMRGIK